jgi:hypothetical protein
MIQIVKADGTTYGGGSIQIINKYGKPKTPVVPPTPTVWGTITGTLTAQTDLTSYLSTNYYPLLTNPAGYITASALTGYVPYTGATGNLDLGTFTLTTPTINGVSSLLKVPNTLVAGYNPVPRTGTATDGVTSVLGDLKSWNSNYHSGEVLYSEISGEALNFGQVCYRNAAGKWQKATGSSSAIAAYNMLGICLQTVAGIDTAISILTRGYVETTYLSAGAVGNPLFMSAATAGSITNTAPSTAGNVVRVIGNVFWSSATQTNSKWIVYFNPDNTWIEL